VTGEIIENDHIAGPECWCQLRFDIGVEDRTVDWRIDDPGCNEAVTFEACHKCLRPPAAKWGWAVQPSTFQATPTQAGHLGVGAGLINEDQPSALLTHNGLAAVFPLSPCLGQFGFVLF